MRSSAAAALVLSLVIGGSAVLAQHGPPAAWGTSSVLEQQDPGPIRWRSSFAVGSTNDGLLFGGVQLPAEGEDFFTWDPILHRSPNRPWRRWGADSTLRVLLRVLGAYRDAHPGAPRLGIADISRPGGGPFGRRFGGLGHASHQNGLDIDIQYPRRDGEERSVDSVAQIARPLARELVRRFVKAGAVYVFVGPNTKLAPPGARIGKTVQRLVYHDDHMHVRFRRPDAR